MRFWHSVGRRALAAFGLLTVLSPAVVVGAGGSTGTTTTTTAAPLPTVWINPNYTGAPWDYQVRAFLPFGDTNWYYIINGGVCEYTNEWPWTLTGGAALVVGNEPWNAYGRYYGSLQLPKGSTATVVPSTINSSDHIRFFVKPPNRSDSQLRVAITVGSADPATYGRPIKTVTYTVSGTGSGWAPSNPMPVPNQLGANGLQTVSIAFTPVGPGTWQVDNILMDPWRNL